jgi:hypothetical protein
MTFAQNHTTSWCPETRSIENARFSLKGRFRTESPVTSSVW